MKRADNRALFALLAIAGGCVIAAELNGIRLIVPILIGLVVGSLSRAIFSAR